jgi:hypothetical protein
VWIYETDPFAPQPSPIHSNSDESDSSKNTASQASSHSKDSYQQPVTPLPHDPSAGKWPLATSMPAQRTLDTFIKSHDKWFVRGISLLIGFLHTKHHVSFRACGIILWTLRSIFIVLGILTSHDHMPTTLGTTFMHLGLTDRFNLLIVCPKCRAISQPPITVLTLEANSLCHLCQMGLYLGISNNHLADYRQSGSQSTKSIKPKIVVPFASLKDLLTKLLSRPGMEVQIDAWHSLPQVVGKYEAIWDGSIWKTILDAVVINSLVVIMTLS